MACLLASVNTCKNLFVTLIGNPEVEFLHKTSYGKLPMIKTTFLASMVLPLSYSSQNTTIPSKKKN
jgi:hypothetical protein